MSGSCHMFMNRLTQFKYKARGGMIRTGIECGLKCAYAWLLIFLIERAFVSS